MLKKALRSIVKFLVVTILVGALIWCGTRICQLIKNRKG